MISGAITTPHRRAVISRLHRSAVIIGNPNSCITGADSFINSTTSAKKRALSNWREERENSESIRAQTLVERVTNFPKGVKNLYYDYILYQNIHDASRTPRNAWTVRDEIFIHKFRVRPGRIPRREFEQQRRFENDIRVMLPLALIGLAPLVGNFFVIGFMLVPRQTLSHHFHNIFEMTKYAEMEHEQRKSNYMSVGNDFWERLSTNQADLLPLPLEQAVTGSDAAGPIFDPTLLYCAFSFYNKAPHTRLQLPKAIFLDLEWMSKEYLVRDL